MSINRVVLSGNLTRDPELRATQSGMNILTFGIAVNDRRRNQQSGEWEDYANFIDCVLFGNRADFLSRTLHKGIKVALEGKLRYSSWERDGQRRSKIEVIVDDIDFVSPRQQQGNYDGGQSYGGQSYGNQSYSQPRQQQPAYNAPAPAAPQGQPTQNQDIPTVTVHPQSSRQNYAQQQPAPQPAPQTPAPQRPAVTTPPQQSDVYDEDIPF
ncbi:MAG: single-stranded DNA-binding protein [Coriobacteriales bacterium]|nr:single-stranded DNA-binding protein [Coriobacteriales bacterium]